MNSKQKRIQSAIKQLQDIYEELFGQKYCIGANIDQNSEFKKIIEEFQEIIYTILCAQDQRDHKQNSKGFKNTPDKVRINFQIRQNLEKAQAILKQAAKKVSTSHIDRKVQQSRQKRLKNCYDSLQDAKQRQSGGTYRPPQYPTVAEMKRDLMGKKNEGGRGNQEQSEYNINDQIEFDKFKEKDQKVDAVLEEVINVNKQVRNKMKNANNAIDVTQEQIDKANKKADLLNDRIKKADKDLAELIKNYKSPSQCCLNVTLVLMVLALIAVIINLIKGNTV